MPFRKSRRTPLANWSPPETHGYGSAEEAQRRHPWYDPKATGNENIANCAAWVDAGGIKPPRRPSRRWTQTAKGPGQTHAGAVADAMEG